MKLHTDLPSPLNTVTAYAEGYIEINGIRYEHGIFFGTEGSITNWPIQNIDELTPEILQNLFNLPLTTNDPLAFLDEQEHIQVQACLPEVVLIGCGRHQHFLSPYLLAPLIKMGIGVEVMNTHAAARTYNILMTEGRRVVAALIPY